MPFSPVPERCQRQLVSGSQPESTNNHQARFIAGCKVAHVADLLCQWGHYRDIYEVVPRSGGLVKTTEWDLECIRIYVYLIRELPVYGLPWQRRKWT